MPVNLPDGWVYDKVFGTDRQCAAIQGDGKPALTIAGADARGCQVHRNYAYDGGAGARRNTTPAPTDSGTADARSGATCPTARRPTPVRLHLTSIPSGARRTVRPTQTRGDKLRQSYPLLPLTVVPKPDASPLASLKAPNDGDASGSVVLALLLTITQRGDAGHVGVTTAATMPPRGGLGGGSDVETGVGAVPPPLLPPERAARVEDGAAAHWSWLASFRPAAIPSSPQRASSRCCIKALGSMLSRATARSRHGRGRARRLRPDQGAAARLERRARQGQPRRRSRPAEPQHGQGARSVPPTAWRGWRSATASPSPEPMAHRAIIA